MIAEAEVSWATFFRYFPRKGDVLVELAARHFNGPVKRAAADGIADGRLRVGTVIERTFVVLLMPVETTAELHTAALLEVFAHPARFAALVDDDGHPQPLVALITDAPRDRQAPRRAPPRPRSGADGADRRRRRTLPGGPGRVARRGSDGAAGECAGCCRAAPPDLATFVSVILARASLGSASMARSPSLRLEALAGEPRSSA